MADHDQKQQAAEEAETGAEQAQVNESQGQEGPGQASPGQEGPGFVASLSGPFPN